MLALPYVQDDQGGNNGIDTITECYHRHKQKTYIINAYIQVSSEYLWNFARYQQKETDEFPVTPGTMVISNHFYTVMLFVLFWT